MSGRWSALGRSVCAAELFDLRVRGLQRASRCRTAARSIYTSSNAQPYGFGRNPTSGGDGSQRLSLRQPEQTRGSGPTVNQYGGNTGFLPVPFVTEQLAGAHHTTDLFSRLLKERIVAVYGSPPAELNGTRD